MQPKAHAALDSPEVVLEEGESAVLPIRWVTKEASTIWVSGVPDNPGVVVAEGECECDPESSGNLLLHNGGVDRLTLEHGATLAVRISGSSEASTRAPSDGAESEAESLSESVSDTKELEDCPWVLRLYTDAAEKMLESFAPQLRSKEKVRVARMR